jgi:translation initiation factor 1
MSLEQNTKSGNIPLNPFGTNNGLLSAVDKTMQTSNEISSAHFKGDIHLKIKNRNAKKFTTYVEGLGDSEYNLDKLAATWRKKYCCSASNDNGTIKLAGDRRESVLEYLVEQKMVRKEQVKVHGY